jgi:iron complex transport system substrate-binding protein
MKTKEKRFVEVAIVFCLLFFVALPSIASATEDEILDIYGNANEDDIIDMRDLTFTARMILRLEDETELADANYDGRIIVADMTQIGLSILGRESKLTLVDSADRIVTVNKPVERIVSEHPCTTEGISLLGAWDRVVGIGQYAADEILFPGSSDLPVCFGPMGYDIYYETVFELDPDILLPFYVLGMPGFEDMIATLEPEGIPVVCLNFERPATLVENIRKLRYVLNTEESGEAYIEFYEGVVNDITAKTSGLSEDDKPQVYVWPFNFDYQDAYMTWGMYSGVQEQMEIAGGISIGKDVEGFCPYVESEWLADRDIDVIVGHVSPAVIPGIFGYDVTDPAVAQNTIDWVMDADENPALELSDAVQNERVYLYQQELMGSPRFVVALAYMAKWFHPELFGDNFDPHEIHMTYLTDYMDVERSEVEDSILFWPEP